MLKDGFLKDLVAYAKADKPEGLFEKVIKLFTFLIADVESTELLEN